MGISTAGLKGVGATLGKIGLGTAVASVILGLSVGPARGQDYHGHDWRYDRRPAYQPYGYAPYGGYPPPTYQPYNYYYVPAPPPVVYVPPPPSLGISLFFPIRIR